MMPAAPTTTNWESPQVTAFKKPPVGCLRGLHVPPTPQSTWARVDAPPPAPLAPAGKGGARPPPPRRGAPCPAAGPPPHKLLSPPPRPPQPPRGGEGTPP